MQPAYGRATERGRASIRRLFQGGGPQNVSRALPATSPLFASLSLLFPLTLSLSRRRPPLPPPALLPLSSSRRLFLPRLRSVRPPWLPSTFGSGSDGSRVSWLSAAGFASGYTPFSCLPRLRRLWSPCWSPRSGGLLLQPLLPRLLAWNSLLLPLLLLLLLLPLLRLLRLLRAPLPFALGSK